MKRRDFFKRSSFALSAAAIAGITGSSFSKLAANPRYKTGMFSLEIITDKPAEAIKLSEEFFRSYSYENAIINFSEYPVAGESSGDIVFVKDGKLINYKEGSQNIRKDIRVIAAALSLPKVISNPSRLRFYVSGNNIPAEKFLIFHKNMLIKSIVTGGKDTVLDIKGTKGNLRISIENSKVRVLDSDCTHKTCINSGSIAFSGESIVCIPNELLILCE
jgi:hypothetical protein